MDEPNSIVVVDHSEIREGKLEELKAVIAELVDLVGENEPRILVWNAYISEEGRELSVLQVHPDIASLEDHLEIAAPVFPKLPDLIEMKSVLIYGRPSNDALKTIREQAQQLGGAAVTLHEWHAGVSHIGEIDIEGAMKSAMDFLGQNEEILRKLSQK